ncbi:hypothetical protein HU200_049608 [Digitaria exilis]|uniref:Uncharacterized protein n=1 Tax=Digitaria exilis TaxID=1010633 RepID=A0A835AUS2_9POAL|nr:hypothetical protein HU200_049608 [Digitaria exilis]
MPTPIHQCLLTRFHTLYPIEVIWGSGFPSLSSLFSLSTAAVPGSANEPPPPPRKSDTDGQMETMAAASASLVAAGKEMWVWASLGTTMVAMKGSSLGQGPSSSLRCACTAHSVSRHGDVPQTTCNSTLLSAFEWTTARMDGVAQLAAPLWCHEGVQTTPGPPPRWHQSNEQVDVDEEEMRKGSTGQMQHPTGPLRPPRRLHHADDGASTQGRLRRTTSLCTKQPPPPLPNARKPNLTVPPLPPCVPTPYPLISGDTWTSSGPSGDDKGERRGRWVAAVLGFHSPPESPKRGEGLNLWTTVTALPLEAEAAPCGCAGRGVGADLCYD